MYESIMASGISIEEVGGRNIMMERFGAVGSFTEPGDDDIEDEHSEPHRRPILSAETIENCSDEK
jgi:hypothetical protein